MGEMETKACLLSLQPYGHSVQTNVPVVYALLLVCICLLAIHIWECYLEFCIHSHCRSLYVAVRYTLIFCCATGVSSIVVPVRLYLSTVASICVFVYHVVVHLKCRKIILLEWAQVCLHLDVTCPHRHD